MALIFRARRRRQRRADRRAVRRPGARRACAAARCCSCSCGWRCCSPATLKLGIADRTPCSRSICRLPAADAWQAHARPTRCRTTPAEGEEGVIVQGVAADRAAGRDRRRAPGSGLENIHERRRTAWTRARLGADRGDAAVRGAVGRDRRRTACASSFTGKFFGVAARARRCSHFARRAAAVRRTSCATGCGSPGAS
ncbi:MAG: hypothetical protein MZW92_28900 [Comamonadaceae bacterium]|nr:hypothetical protein [Comamonadaceae bacterium]